VLRIFLIAVLLADVGFHYIQRYETEI